MTYKYVITNSGAILLPENFPIGISFNKSEKHKIKTYAKGCVKISIGGESPVGRIFKRVAVESKKGSIKVDRKILENLLGEDGGEKLIIPHLYGKVKSKKMVPTILKTKKLKKVTKKIKKRKKK